MPELPVRADYCTCLHTFLGTPAIYVENRKLVEALRELVALIDADVELDAATERARALLPASPR